MMRNYLLIKIVTVALLLMQTVTAFSKSIDRHALVTRHNVVLNAVNINSPLSVGNGEFAFTVDVTGLQTFEEAYNRGIPLSTMSQWGFHTAPNPKGFTLEKFPLTMSESHGRKVPYLYFEKGNSPAELEEATNYLYSNPSRLHLGRISMALKSSDGQPAKLTDLKAIHQELNLWTGQISSHFTFDGEAVEVITSCHPENDQVAVHIESALIAKGQLSVMLEFPYGATAFNGNGADWKHPEAHQTIMTRKGSLRADFARTLDADHYNASLQWSDGISLNEAAQHSWKLSANGHSKTIEFVAAFSPKELPVVLPGVSKTEDASIVGWKKFWNRRCY